MNKNMLQRKIHPVVRIIRDICCMQCANEIENERVSFIILYFVSFLYLWQNFIFELVTLYKCICVVSSKSVFLLCFPNKPNLPVSLLNQKLLRNKKVLLRDRKRLPAVAYPPPPPPGYRPDWHTFSSPLPATGLTGYPSQERIWDQRLGYPPNRHMPVKTLPSPSFGYRQ